MKNRNGLQSHDYRALSEFRYQIRRFLRFSEEAARKAQLAPQHHQLMLAVKGSTDEQQRIGDLAERLQIQHHSAVELVDRLVRKGLIRRSRGSEDRREVYVRLTSRGERILEELTRQMRAELHSAAPALVQSLRKLTSNEKSSRIIRKKQTTVAVEKR